MTELLSIFYCLTVIVTHTFIPVKVTAYSARMSETDSTPTITASNKKVKEGYIALSRDLEKRFKLKFGDKIYLSNIGVFEFQDRMHRRKRNQVDIFMKSTKKAKEFGVQKGMLIVKRVK